MINNLFCKMSQKSLLIWCVADNYTPNSWKENQWSHFAKGNQHFHTLNTATRNAYSESYNSDRVPLFLPA